MRKKSTNAGPIGWLALSVGAVALATCGAIGLTEGAAEGQLRPVDPSAPSAGEPSRSEGPSCGEGSGDARLVRAATTCQDCAPSGAVLELIFEGAVDTERVLEGISITPEAVLQSRSGRCARRVLVGGTLAAQTAYEVTIRAGASERVLSFDTGGGRPHVRMASPMAVLAADADLPVQLEGVRRARLRAMSLRADEIARAAEFGGVHRAGRDPVEQMPAAWRRRFRELAIDPAAGDERGVQLVDAFALAGGQGPALVVLEAPGAAARVTIAQRATNVVLLKVGRAGGLVWVADPRVGRSIAHASVTIFEGTERRARGRTDASGLYRLPAESTLRRATAEGASRGPLRAVVQHGGQITYASESFATGIEAWQLEVPHARYGADAETRGMVTAERGIYRPGETVHLLGILRAMTADGTLRPPRGRVTVEVFDPDGSPIHRSRSALTPYGTFREALVLDAGSRLGRYQVVVRPARGAALTHRFEVGEYRPDSFAVEVPPAGPAELVGGEVVMPIRARYLYGAPVPGVEAEWTLAWRPHRVQLAGAPDYTFGAAEDARLRHLTGGTVTLDADGEAEVRVPRVMLPSRTRAQAIDLVFEVSVRDAADDTVSARTVQTVSTRDHLLGIRNRRWVVNVDDGWDIAVAAVSADGTRLAGELVELRLIQTVWRTHAERGSSGVRYDGEWEDVTVASREVRSTLADRSVHFDLPSGGGYRVEVLDAGGLVLCEAHVWAAGEGGGAPVYNHPRVEVLAEHRSYAPGDTASLYAQIPWERSLALVTVEREGVLEARVERLDGAATPIRVEVTDAHAPNVFVGVAALPISSESPASGVPLRVGYRELVVSAERRRLHVTVRPAQDDYEPGEPATVDVQVRDSRGRPVRAEVTLWAADEGVLALTGYQSPDPFAAAHARHLHAVSTAASVAEWTQPDPLTWPDGGGDGAPSAASALRSRFLSTAFFSRGVVTNAAGRARVRFDLPDNLTRWRVMASVADRGERFGRGEASVTTSKELSALPTLPRFLTQGDLVDAGVIVHNHTGADGTAEIRISVDGPGEVVGADVQRVEVADGEQVPVRFPVMAHGTGSLEVRARVTLGGASDGWTRTLTVHPATSRAGVHVSGGAIDAAAGAWLRVPEGAEREQTELVVTVSHGVYAAMEAGLDALVRYPHGCVEQTTSGLIPMVLLEDLARDLGSGLLRGAEHRARMEGAIAHVLRHQNTDGGFGLWPTSDSEGFLTAYALWGLLTARDHGYSVREAAVEDAVAYLGEHATEGDDMHGQFSSQETRPFAAYVLAHAQRDDSGLSTRLAGEHANLTRFSVGLLANALSRRERAEAGPLFASLDVAIAEVDGVRLVQDPTAGGRFMRYGADLRATSSAVQALVAADRRQDAADLVAGILERRRPDGTWGTTYNNMWALYALTTYASASRRGAAGGSVEIRIGDRVVRRARLAGSARAQQIVIPASSLPRSGRSERLTITASAGSDLRYAARLRYVMAADRQEPTSSGLTISRQLFDARSGRRVEHPTVGQILRIRLTVRSSRPIDQVAVTDHLPAGFEAIDQRLATRGVGGAEVGGSPWAWQEIHDERVTFFANRLHAGSRSAEYLARATRSGEFVRPAPRAEAMYDPTIYGLGEIERVVVTRAP